MTDAIAAARGTRILSMRASRTGVLLSLRAEAASGLRRQRSAQRSACADVVRQILDLVALLLRDELDEVADRDHPDERAVFDHRGVAHPPIRHQCHRLV